MIVDSSPLHVTEIENSDGTKVAAGTSLADEHGTLTVNADGTYTYTVTPGLDLPKGSTLTDTFKYSAVDGEGDATGSMLTITINGTNGLPVANADVNTVTEPATGATSVDRKSVV